MAVNLPNNIKFELIKHQKKWFNLPVRWTIKPNIHITLVFIGYTTDNEMYEICNITKKTAKQHQPFKINLNKIILGPPGKFPRMFWVEGEKSQELAVLKRDLENSLFDSTHVGYDRKEARAFHPHITLGRIKKTEWDNLKYQPEINQSFKHSFLVESIEVMQSNLKRTGAEYSVLESIEL